MSKGGKLYDSKKPVVFEYEGKKYVYPSIKAACDYWNIRVSAVWSRKRRGWSPIEALVTPTGQKPKSALLKEKKARALTRVKCAPLWHKFLGTAAPRYCRQVT